MGLWNKLGVRCLKNEENSQESAGGDQGAHHRPLHPSTNRLPATPSLSTLRDSSLELPPGFTSECIDIRVGFHPVGSSTKTSTASSWRRSQPAARQWPGADAGGGISEHRHIFKDHPREQNKPERMV